MHAKSVQFTCAFCGESNQVEADQGRRRVKCRGCGEKSLVSVGGSKSLPAARQVRVALVVAGTFLALVALAGIGIAVRLIFFGPRPTP